MKGLTGITHGRFAEVSWLLRPIAIQELEGCRGQRLGREPGSEVLVCEFMHVLSEKFQLGSGNDLESGNSITEWRVRRAGDRQRREKIAYIPRAFVSAAKVLGRPGMRSSTTL